MIFSFFKNTQPNPRSSPKLKQEPGLLNNNEAGKFSRLEGNLETEGWRTVHANFSHHQDAMGVNPSKGLFVVCDGAGAYLDSAILAQEIASYMSDLKNIGASPTEVGIMENIDTKKFTRTRNESTDILAASTFMFASIPDNQLTSEGEAEEEQVAITLSYLGDSCAYILDNNNQIVRSFNEGYITNLVRELVYVRQITNRDNTAGAEINIPHIKHSIATLKKGQKLVICSDGVTDSLPQEARLERVIAQMSEEISNDQGLDPEATGRKVEIKRMATAQLRIIKLAKKVISENTKTAAADLENAIKEEVTNGNLRKRTVNGGKRKESDKEAVALYSAWALHIAEFRGTDIDTFIRANTSDDLTNLYNSQLKKMISH